MLAVEISALLNHKNELLGTRKSGIKTCTNSVRT